MKIWCVRLGVFLAILTDRVVATLNEQKNKIPALCQRNETTQYNIYFAR